MEPPSSTDRGAEGEDEWELCNDEGFVYKRKKRRVDSHPDAAAGPSGLSDPTADPDGVERNPRERKRGILLKLKRKYEREIYLWEMLSHNLSTIGKRQQEEQRRKLEEEETEPLPESCSGGVRRPTGDASTPPSLLDELLSLAEAQEAVICDVSNMCNVAEAMREAREEQLCEPFLDLPIWGSPRELMASLCDD